MGFWSTLGKIGSNLLQGAPIVGGLIQGNINAKIARENTDRTIAANKEMAAYQYSKDLEMWNRGNVYNSPLAQMDRLKAAGLNPNMVYGSGSAAGMAAGQLPRYNAPTLDYNYIPPVDIPSVISAFQNFRLGNAQIRNAEEIGKAKTAENAILDAMREQTTEGGGWRRGSLREFTLSDRATKLWNEMIGSSAKARVLSGGVGYQLDALKESAWNWTRRICVSWRQRKTWI